MLPFSAAEFFEVFRRYNEAVWPAQVLLYGVAAFVLVMLRTRPRFADRAIAVSLAFLWLWSGIVYHQGFFREINPAAPWFAALAVVGAGIFLREGVASRRLRFMQLGVDWRSGLAGAVIAYALVIYPAVGLAAGLDYWASPTFGAPCPTTIFMLGVLMLAARPCPVIVLLVPLVWSLIGTQGALLLQVPQDLGLAVAAVLSLVLLVRDRVIDTP